MKYQITHYQKNRLIDQYEPKANPLSCLKGRADELSNGIKTDYVVFINGDAFGVFDWPGLVNFLSRKADENQTANVIKAYFKSSQNNDYVELKAIED